MRSLPTKLSGTRSESVSFTVWGLGSLVLLMSGGALMAGDQAGPALPQPEPEAPMVAETPDVVRVASLAAPAEPQLDVMVEPSGLPSASSEVDAEFKELLVPNQLTGWVIHEGRANSWTSEGQTVRSSGNGAGWLLTEQSYSDFILRFDYRLATGGNSGVAIRCASEGNPAFSGLEIQLLDDDSPKYVGLNAAQYTGSIYYRVAPQVKAPLNAKGEWNECEIRAVGPQVDILINGTLVNSVHLRTPRVEGTADADMDEPAARPIALGERPPLGRIGLQSHSSGVEFRNVSLKNLCQKLPSGLEVATLQPGSGETATEDDTVALHYVGQLVDGTQFTNTYPSGDPIAVSLKDVIPGWQKGISGMKVGERRKLIIPPELGYGEEGFGNLIPPQATLIFEVELCRVDR